MKRIGYLLCQYHYIELRTPLTLILSPLQELLGTVRPSDTVYTKLAAMYRNGTSLQTLVDHLLYVQKIEAGILKRIR